MNYTTFQAATKQAGLPVEVDAFSVYRAFEQIQDGRHKRGVRYSSALILTLIVLATLAGMTTLAGIAAGVRLRATWLNQVLPHPRESFACAATYSHVFRALDAQQVTQVLNDLLTRVAAMQRGGEHPHRLSGQAEGEQPVQVALDGKTLRGTLGHAAADQQQLHQLTLDDTQTGVLLKEQVTGEKQHERSSVS
jgi:DDE_Tnp_1-associated